MSNRMIPPLAVVALAAILWVVPSIGSQGLGTIGEPFGHADRSLVENALSPDGVRDELRRADARVENILAH